MLSVCFISTPKLRDAWHDQTWHGFDCSEENTMEIGLVVDSHLQKSFINLGITSEWDPDRSAIEVEAWLDPNLFYM